VRGRCEVGYGGRSTDRWVLGWRSSSSLIGSGRRSLDPAVATARFPVAGACRDMALATRGGSALPHGASHRQTAPPPRPGRYPPPASRPLIREVLRGLGHGRDVLPVVLPRLGGAEGPGAGNELGDRTPRRAANLPFPHSPRAMARPSPCPRPPDR